MELELRDYLAATALQSIISSPEPADPTAQAEAAYSYADAMLAVRSDAEPVLIIA